MCTKLTQLVMPKTVAFFERAGWYEGRSMHLPDRYFESIPDSFGSKREAVRFLTEFSGLIIRGEDGAPVVAPDGSLVPARQRWVRIEKRAAYPESRLRCEGLNIADVGIAHGVDIMDNGNFSRFLMISDGRIFEDIPDEQKISYFADNWWGALDELLLELN